MHVPTVCRRYSSAKNSLPISETLWLALSMLMVILARGHGSGRVDRQCSNSEVALAVLWEVLAEGAGTLQDLLSSLLWQRGLCCVLHHRVPSTSNYIWASSCERTPSELILKLRIGNLRSSWLTSSSAAPNDKGVLFI